MKRIYAILVAIALLATATFTAARITAASANLIPNPSVAAGTTTTPEGWLSNNWGTNTASMTYRTTEGRTDSSSVYVQVTAYSSGDAKWYFSSVPVQANTSHTYSDYTKSNVTTRLVAQYTSTTGAVSYAELGTVPASTSWIQKSVTFTTPANVARMSVFHVIDRVGWMQTDDFSLVDNSVNRPAPTVSFSSPTNGSTVSGTAAIAANAAATDSTVAGVQFKIDGVNAGAEDTTAPYSINWDTTRVTDGSHTLTATARDAGGLTTTATSTVTVRNAAPATPPTVTITAPANGATVANTVTVAANAAATGSSIAGVQFKLDGVNLGAEDTTAPYSVQWDTTTATSAQHTLTATARNSAGLAASATSSVTVSNAQAPQPASILPNGSAEIASTTNPALPANWIHNSWGTNTPVFTYPVAGDGSAKAVRVSLSAYTSGDAKWYIEPQAVEANTSYIYSDSYRADTRSEVVVAMTDTAGNTTYTYLTSLPAAATFQNFAYEFKTGAATQSVAVFHLINSIGWLELDNVALAKPQIGASLLPNNSLEQSGTPTQPLRWNSSSWGTNTPTFEHLNSGRTGNRSVRVTVNNYVDGDAKWYPEPITTLERGKQYRFSTWYKTNTIPHAVAMYVKDDGTTRYFGMPDPQPNGGADWQHYSDTFNVPLDAKAVSVFLFVSANGYVQTDDYDITAYTPVGLNRPLVTFTFDDGEEDNVLTALPRLGAYGYKTTQCFATDHIEGNAANTSAVLEFFRAGHEICSHTVTHPFMTKVSQTQLAYELTHSKQVLENITGKPVTSFATPYGDYNAAVNAEIRKHYTTHRTVDEGYNSKDNFDAYRIRSQNMLSTTTIDEFNYWLNRAKTDNTWLVLVYHRVADNPGPYDTYRADFDRQLEAIKASGISVVTYEQALAEVRGQL